MPVPNARRALVCVLRRSRCCSVYRRAGSHPIASRPVFTIAVTIGIWTDVIVAIAPELGTIGPYQILEMPWR